MVTASKGNRLHIGIFGRRNAGKSSLINAITNQQLALVSDVAGTTTDPVFKAMEILPLGPVSLIDTAGLDDIGELGEKRVEKSRRILSKCDFVLIVADSKDVVDNNIEFEKQFIDDVKKRKIKGILVINKIDLQPFDEKSVEKTKNNLDFPVFAVSSVKKTGITELKNFIAKKASGSMTDPSLIGDLIEKNDLIFLVCPIDNAAPKGRMILPQVQVIRDVLDNDGIAIVMKDTELEESFKKLGKPKLVITDSQAFKKVSALTAEDVMLTSFSIVFARQKGNLEILKKGVRKIDKLQNGDKILVAEACTHHCQSDDIGRYKIPAWLREKTGKNLTFEYTTGGDFPANLKDYALVVHCGGCMINRREMLYRLEFTEEKGVPIVNYGLLIAYVNGIFERAIKVFN